MSNPRTLSNEHPTRRKGRSTRWRRGLPSSALIVSLVLSGCASGNPVVRGTRRRPVELERGQIGKQLKPLVADSPEAAVALAAVRGRRAGANVAAVVGGLMGLTGIIGITALAADYGNDPTGETPPYEAFAAVGIAGAGILFVGMLLEPNDRSWGHVLEVYNEHPPRSGSGYWSDELGVPRPRGIGRDFEGEIEPQPPGDDQPDGLESDEPELEEPEPDIW